MLKETQNNKIIILFIRRLKLNNNLSKNLTNDRVVEINFKDRTCYFDRSCIWMHCVHYCGYRIRFHDSKFNDEFILRPNLLLCRLLLFLQDIQEELDFDLV